MKYRIRFRKEPNNNISETVESVDDDGSVHIAKQMLGEFSDSDDVHRPLCLQLLNSFSANDFEFNRKGYTGLHHTLFSEFIQHPISKCHIKEVYALKDTLREKGQRDRLPRKCKDLVDRFEIEKEIKEWIASDEWKYLIKRHELEKVLILCELMVCSPHFSGAIRKYYRMLTVERYGDNTISQAYALSEINGSMSALWAFAYSYFVKGKSLGNRFVRMAEIFLERYMTIDVHESRVNPVIDEIDRWSRILASKGSEYPILDESIKCEVLQPYAAQLNYWSERKIDKLSAARNLQLCCNYYVDKLELDFFGSQGKEALAKTNILLPPNATYGNDSANQNVDDPYRSRYGNITWISSLVDELDILTREIESEDYFECDDYIALCGLSLYCIIKHNLPIAICSACGRYYVPKQDRKSATKYCYYVSPKDSNYSCSDYHSQFESKYDGGSEYKEIDRQIGSVRTTISNIDDEAPLIRILNQQKRGIHNCYDLLVDFARGSLSIIAKQAKEADLNHGDLEGYSHAVASLKRFLKYCKDKRMSPETLIERKKNLSTIFSLIDTCFTEGVFDANYEMWKRVMDQLLGIMNQKAPHQRYEMER